MYDVLNELCDPVACESDEDYQADDLCRRAASTRAGRISPAAVGLVFDVDRYQRDREPSSESECYDAANSADCEDVTVILGYIHRGLQHQHTERYPGNPGDEADNGEDTEDGKYYRG